MVVIPKPGKAPEVKQTAGGWRPISLISTIGKFLEKEMCLRLIKAAKLYGLLLNSQISNRKIKLTDVAIKVVAENA